MSRQRFTVNGHRVVPGAATDRTDETEDLTPRQLAQRARDRAREYDPPDDDHGRPWSWTTGDTA